MGFLLQRPKIEDTFGPRLEDRKITDSAYGIGIQKGFGTVRVAGNIIHGLELTEAISVERIDTGGKGLKGRAPTNTTYSYYATFAVSLGKGIVDAILRIWFDGTLVYDVKDRSVSRPINFTLYKGTENQEPDPTLQAIDSDVSGYRGQAYVVFDNISLEETGRKIPNITFECIFADVGAVSISTTVSENLELRSDYSPDFQDENRICIDWYRDVMYVGTSGVKIVVYKLSDMSVLRVLPNASAGRLIGVSTIDGSLIVSSTSAGGENSRIDQYTGQVLTTSNYNSGSLFNYMIGFACPIFSIGSFGVKEAIISRQVNGTVPELAVFDGDTLNDIEIPIILGNSGYSHLHHTAGFPGDGKAYAGLISANDILIYEISVGWEVSEDASGYTGSATATLLTTIVPTDINSAWTSFSFKVITAFDEVVDGVAFFFDFTDGAIVTAATDNGGTGETRAFKYDPVSNSIIWISEDLPVGWPGNGNQTIGQHYTSGGYFGYTTSLPNSNNQNFTLIDLRTGLIDDYYDGSGTGLNIGWPEMLWDGDRQAVFGVKDSATRDYGQRSFIGVRVTQNVNVSDIISYYCDQAGLVPAQYDVTAVTDTLNGFLVTDSSSSAENIKDILEVLHIDAVESDGVLTFVPRADTVDWTIDQADFVRTKKNGRLYDEERKRERDLPVRLEVTARSEARDYENNTLGAERSTYPNTIVRSAKKEDISLPAVMTDNDIRRSAEKLLFTRWVERDELKFALPKKYLGVEPTDVINITLDDGSDRNFRVKEVTIGKNLRISVEAVRQIDGQYNSTILGDAGQTPLRNQRLKGINPELFILDTTLLRDEDSLDQTGHRSYWAAAYYGNLTFNGAALFKSNDAIAWSEVDISANEVTWGVTETTLGVPDSPWRWDYTNTLTVRLVTGSIASDTEANVLNGSNAAIILQSNGEVEIIQFKTAAATSTSNQYILSDLIRGRRGTDTMMSNHGAGDKIVFLSIGKIRAMRLDLSRRNVTTFFKGVTQGMLFEDSLPKAEVISGRDQMPYAPRNTTASFSGSDIVLTWVRRTRVGGEWIDGTGTVPLSETLEQYEVEIYNNAGTTLLRTIVVDDAQTTTYTVAQQTADSWDGSTHIKVVIYQMSGIVGRGFGEQVTLEIT